MVKLFQKGKKAINPFQQLSAGSALPELLSAKPIPSLFEDSTHELWRCDTTDGEMVLKLCHRQNIEQSAIWQIMQQLFAVSLPDDLSRFAEIQASLESQSVLPVPELVACHGENGDSPAFILSRVVDGEALQQKQLTDDMLCQFAKQVASFHLQQQATWGKITQADQAAKDWPAILLKTLLRHSSKLRIGEPWLYKVMTQIEHVNPRYFAPIMLDNRWDQYLVKDGRISALVDLDAFVIGPPELELILLEYQLNAKQAAVFANEYQTLLPMPELSQQRQTYRLLLFLMNALGETNLDRWMKAESHW